MKTDMSVKFLSNHASICAASGVYVNIAKLHITSCADGFHSSLSPNAYVSGAVRSSTRKEWWRRRSYYGGVLSELSYALRGLEEHAGIDEYEYQYQGWKGLN
jgi:hypothetical protein